MIPKIPRITKPDREGLYAYARPRCAKSLAQVAGTPEKELRVLARAGWIPLSDPFWEGVLWWGPFELGRKKP